MSIVNADLVFTCDNFNSLPKQYLFHILIILVTRQYRLFNDFKVIFQLPLALATLMCVLPTFSDNTTSSGLCLVSPQTLLYRLRYCNIKLFLAKKVHQFVGLNLKLYVTRIFLTDQATRPEQ